MADYYDVEEFTLESLEGRYIGLVQGDILDPPAFKGPVASLGSVIFDGNGKATATDTVSINGTILERVGAGKYEVNSDGSGSFEITWATGTPGRTGNFTFFITDGGRELRALARNPGTVVWANYRRQS